MRSLSDKMEFDCVIEVLPGGAVHEASGVYAPSLHEGELSVAGGGDGGWVLMDGYSGQDRYSGPIMHASESIGGQMERDILANPGYYVTLVDYPDDADDEPEGWAVAFMPATT